MAHIYLERTNEQLSVISIKIWQRLSNVSGYDKHSKTILDSWRCKSCSSQNFETSSIKDRNKSAWVKFFTKEHLDILAVQLQAQINAQVNSISQKWLQTVWQ